MRYRVNEEIRIDILNGEMIIPEGTILYKLPNDHIQNSRDFNCFGLNGEVIQLEKDCDKVEKID